MEEWHQKLHNNTSPDDVAICQALIAYLQNNLDISHYWATLEVTLCISLLEFAADRWDIRKYHVVENSALEADLPGMHLGNSVMGL